MTASAAPRDVHTVLAVGAIHGAIEPLERVLAGGPKTDAAVVVGDLVDQPGDSRGYRAVFKALGSAHRPAFWVPGPDDAPIGTQLTESAPLEIVYPLLRGIHGTLALAPGPILFAGMGGEILDDPATARSEDGRLRYPAWEVDYRLKALRDFDKYPKVFLFGTSPAHKGLGEPGSTVLAELIKTYNPRLVVVDGEEQHQTRLANTLVVCPGRLDCGEFAVIDLDARSAGLAMLADRRGTRPA